MRPLGALLFAVVLAACPACLDEPLTHENLARESSADESLAPAEPPDVPASPGAEGASQSIEPTHLSFPLRSGDLIVEVVSLRVTDVRSRRPIVSQTLNVLGTEDEVSVALEIPPGDYVLEMRAVTVEGHPCSGQNAFSVEPHAVAQVSLSVHCDPRQLAVGTAEVSVVDSAGTVVATQTLEVAQLGSSFQLADLPAGHYVVWITATTVDGRACSGSAPLEVEPGTQTPLDFDVICER